MSKQDCIIDACSYIYLRKFTFLKRGEAISSFDLLSEVVNIKHHSIISDEIKRNFSVTTDEAIQINNREYSLQSYVFEHYDSILYNNTITNAESEKDKGEKLNLISALDILLKKKKIPIYLTDDLKALEEKEIFNNFLLYSIWTSFDAIIFLFLVSEEMNYNRAIKAITDLTNFLHQPTYKNYIDDRERKIKETPSKRKDILNEYSKKIRIWSEKTQKRKLKYAKRLNLIKKLKSN